MGNRGSTVGRFLRSAALAGLLLQFGCRQPSDPYVYTSTQSGNVSTLDGPAGPARKTVNDPTVPQFYWRTADSLRDSISGYQGKVIVLNFWATWCGPCRAEMPDLEAISKMYSTDSVVVIGVAEDANGNVVQEVRDFVNSNNITYPIIVDSMFRVYEQFVPTSFAIPYTFIIDPNGNVNYYFVGEATKQQFIARINAAK